MKTDLIGHIRPELRSSWDNKLFITLDIDWAHDDILSDAIDLLEELSLSATWFVTHPTPLLDRLRDNPAFELGVHPNFNYLLDGDLSIINEKYSKRKGEGETSAFDDSLKAHNSEEILNAILQVVPEANSIRSHSMTQNTRLLELFRNNGLTHDCNHFIPYQSGMALKPWKLWNGLIKCPFFWEDDISCMYGEMSVESVGNLLKAEGLKIFNFHPIHLFLNTEVMDRYRDSRMYHKDPDTLSAYRNTGFGARSFMEEIASINCR